MALDAVFIAGPTASGKSALALALAERFDAVVINADSMQVYSDLHILSARPSAEDEAACPHRLYGHIDGSINYSVAQWLSEVEKEVKAARASGRLPLITGGTGLYFKALTSGLAHVPDVPEEVRSWVRSLTVGEAYAELSARDPLMAARLNSSDSQRIARALEVVRAHNTSLADYQAHTQPGFLGSAEAAEGIVAVKLLWERSLIYARSDMRFDMMLEAGGFSEAARLAERGLSPDLPVMKALGVPSLVSALKGDISQEAAVEEAKMLTRRFIKRQLTWYRNQFPHWHGLNAQLMESEIDKISNLISKKLLTQ